MAGMKWSNPDEKPSWVRWAETPIMPITPITPIGDDPDGDLDEREFPDPMNSTDAAAYVGVASCTLNRAVRRGELEATTGPGRGHPNWFQKANLDRYKERKERSKWQKGKGPLILTQATRRGAGGGRTPRKAGRHGI